jgi:hypothetical protein
VIGRDSFAATYCPLLPLPLSLLPSLLLPPPPLPLHCLTPVRFCASSQQVALQQCICTSGGRAPPPLPEPTAPAASASSLLLSLLLSLVVVVVVVLLVLEVKRYFHTDCRVAAPLESVAAHSHLTFGSVQLARPHLQIENIRLD